MRPWVMSHLPARRLMRRRLMRPVSLPSGRAWSCGPPPGAQDRAIQSPASTPVADLGADSRSPLPADTDPMPQDWYSLDELAEHLGRDRREIERLANRGRIPGHKRSSEWQFHNAEITQWLEQEMREYSDTQLAAVEKSLGSSHAELIIPLSELIAPETVQVPLEARTRRSVLESLVEVAGRTWKIWQPAQILKAVHEREDLMSTAFDHGVAIPHPRQQLPDALGDSVVAFGRTLSGIPFGAANNSLTDLFFLVVCRDARTHLHVLARLGRLVQKQEFVEQVRAAPDSRTAYDTIVRADEILG